jgi:xanthine dehydrogenase accessory factor
VENIFEVAATRLKAGRKSALVTVTQTSGSTPRRAGTKMLIDSDGTTVGTIGGGELEERVVAAALDVIACGEPKLLSFTLDRDKGNLDMMCGGEIDLYIDPILPAAQVAIFRA